MWYPKTLHPVFKGLAPPPGGGCMRKSDHQHNISTRYTILYQNHYPTQTLSKRNLDIHPLLCWRAPCAHVYCEVWIQPTDVEHLEGSFFALSTQWLVIRMALQFSFQRYVIQRIFKQNKTLKCPVPKHYKKTKTNMIEKILTKYS